MMTGRRVLVVDDDAAMRQMIRWTLEEDGFLVTEAASASQAIEVALSAAPALVLMDFGLPDGDGAGLAASLRERLPGNAPPIVMITADGRAAEKARRSGAYAYLHKPFDLEDLLATVRRAPGE